MTEAARQLVVNADDFGLSDGVNRGILTAHRDGIVTSTSVLALAPAWARGIRSLAECPALGIGVHLALVGEDPPLCVAREIPTLVDRHGRLAASWRVLLARLATRRVDLDDVRRELAAQIDVVTEEAERPLDHLDTHQHVHLWPALASVVVGLAAERGIGSVRTPMSHARGPKGVALRRLSTALRDTIAEEGLTTTDTSAGLDEAGGMTADRMVTTLRRLADGHARSAELSFHPGAAGDPDLTRYRWGYRWSAELAAATSARVRATVDTLGFRLVRFADLGAPPC